MSLLDTFVDNLKLLNKYKNSIFVTQDLVLTQTIDYTIIRMLCIYNSHMISYAYNIKHYES
jgi:hypothetical protein